MLPKDRLTSHSRMSGSKWVTALWWLSGSYRLFLYSSPVYSCHFLISSASVKSSPFLSFFMPIFAWSVLLISPVFLKRSLVFSVLLSSSIYWHCSVKKAFFSLLTILWNSAFQWIYLSFSPLLFNSLLFSAICKASTDNHVVRSFQFWKFLSYIVKKQLTLNNSLVFWITIKSRKTVKVLILLIDNFRISGVCSSYLK